MSDQQQPATIPVPMRVGRIQFGAGSEVQHVQSAIDRLSVRLEETRKALDRARAVVGVP